MDDFSKELTAEMMPGELWRRVAEAIGAENIYKIAMITGGVTVYVPRAESIIRPIRDAHIKNEFNGFNHYELAEKYDVTERWVRELCGIGIVEGQIDFWSEPNDESRN